MINIPEEIKMLFKSDSIRKNIRIHFPNGEREDITNSQIYAENSGERFSFTESLCSRNELKFGLCEASYVEFECMEIENIKGYEIEVFHEIDISSLPDEFITEYGLTSNDVTFPYYRLPYGRFVIDSCIKQSDMKKRKVVAYTWTSNDFKNLSSIEKAKRNAGVRNNATYNADFVSFMLSNIKGAYRTNGDLFNVENLKIGTDSYETAYISSCTYYRSDTMGSVDGNITIVEQWRARGKCLCIPIGVGSDIENKLLKINYSSFSDSEKQIEEFLTIKESIRWGYNFVNPTIAHIQIADMVSASSYRTKEVPIDTEYLIYPYISGIDSNTGSYFKIYVPLTVSIEHENKRTGETDVLGSWTFIDENSVEIKVCTLKEDVLTKTLSLERALGDDGSYRVSKYDSDFNHMLTSWLEINGLFGKASRNGELEFFSVLDNFCLFPSEDLYPSEDLFPSEKMENMLSSEYRSLWTDDYFIQPYGKIVVDYIGADNKIQRYAYKFDSTYKNIYYIANNYFFTQFQWTTDEIKTLLERYFIPNIRGISYIPMELEMKGLPYIESGDMLSVHTDEMIYETFVFHRQLRGIQSLMDSIKVYGDEYNADTTDESTIIEEADG